MVYIRLAQDAKEHSFPDEINIYQTFGKYITLLDEKGKSVPLNLDGYPVHKLNPKTIYTVQFQNFGFDTTPKKNKKKKEKI